MPVPIAAILRWVIIFPFGFPVATGIIVIIVLWFVMFNPLVAKNGDKSTPKTIIWDENHELAGKNLTFENGLISVNQE